MAGARIFPARFLFVGAMNPCPCGHHGDPRVECRCTPNEVARYRKKISGPLLDRIDLHVEVPAVPATDFHSEVEAEPTAAVQRRVVAARKKQTDRTGDPRLTNGNLPTRQLKKVVRLDGTATALMEKAVDKLNLSARGYQKVLRVARTIADLQDVTDVASRHLSDAMRYRAAQTER